MNSRRNLSCRSGKYCIFQNKSLWSGCIVLADTCWVFVFPADLSTRECADTWSLFGLKAAAPRLPVFASVCRAAVRAAAGCRCKGRMWRWSCRQRQSCFCSSMTERPLQLLKWRQHAGRKQAEREERKPGVEQQGSGLWSGFRFFHRNELIYHSEGRRYTV